MISIKAKHNEVLSNITWLNKTLRETAARFGMGKPGNLYHLLVLYAIQVETRNLVTISQVKERTGDYHSWVKPLLELGYIERIGFKPLLYNVTMSGEYVVRAFFIRLSRFVNDTKLSKARLKREQREKLKAFRRPANVKGVKLY